MITSFFRKIKVKESFIILALAIYFIVLFLMFFRSGDYAEAANMKESYRYLIILAQFGACGVIVLLAKSKLRDFIVAHHIKILIGIFTVAIAIRIIFIFAIAVNLTYAEDFGRYLKYTEVLTTTGGQGFSPDVLKYISIFPHIIGTPIIMSSFLSITGYSLTNYLLINSIFGILSGVVIYFIMKQVFSKSAALISVLVWGINPLCITYEMFTSEVSILTLLSLLAILLWIKVLNQKNFKLVLLYTVLFGIVCAIAQFVRPVAIIFIIAALLTMFIYKKNTVLSVKQMFRNSKVAANLLIAVIIVVTFSICNHALKLKIESYTNNKLPSQRIGYNLYVGSTLEREGQWTATAEKFFRQKMTELNPTELHEFFLKEGLNNYKENGIVNNLNLFHDKLEIITNHTVEKPVLFIYKGIEKASPDIAETANKYNVWINMVCVIFVSFNYACAALGAIGIWLKYKKSKHIDSGIFMMVLMFVGVMISSLLFEVSFRYTYFVVLLPILLVPGIFGFIKRKPIS